MAVLMLKKVTINSVDVSSYVISFKVDKTFGDAVTSATIVLARTVSSVLTLANGQTVSVQRGWVTSTDEYIFREGTVESLEPKGGTIEVQVKNKMYALIRKNINKKYLYDGSSSTGTTSGIISEIYKDIVSTYGGLTADNTSVQATGAAYRINKFICKDTDILERLKKLQETMDWQQYYEDDADKVYFEPKGFNTNTNVLTIGDNVLNVPEWKYDTQDMFNQVKISGASLLVETTESGQIDVTAGYLTTGITILNVPDSVKVYMDAANPPTTLKTGGQLGSSSSYDYYVDRDNLKIMPATSFTTNHYAEIRYSYYVPTPVIERDEPSISAYKLRDTTITYSDIKDVADAENRGLLLLARYSQPFVSAVLKVNDLSTINPKIGQKIRVVDNINRPTVDRWLVINRHVVYYPQNVDELYVGDREWKLSAWASEVMNRLKRLEEESSENTDLLVMVQQNKSDFYVKREQLIVEKNDLTSSTRFLLGSPTHGKLGDTVSSLLGGSNTGTVTHEYVWNRNNRWTEGFIDTEFKDTANTTATWDTTNKRVDFTSGQEVFTDRIAAGQGTITAVANTDTTTGTLAFFANANDGAGNFLTGTFGAGGNAPGYSTGISTRGSYSMEFDGADASSEYITMGDNTNFEIGSGDWTFAVWIRLAAAPTATNVIFSKWKGTGSQKEWAFVITSAANWGILLSANGSTALGYYANTTLSDSVNTHLCVVRKSGYVYWYLNGVSARSPYSIAFTMYSGTAAAYIGAVEDGGVGTSAPDDGFNGKIDDLFFWKGYGLTATEVLALVTSGTIPSTKPTAAYEFEENTGTSAYDTSSWMLLDEIGISKSLITTGNKLRIKAIETGASTARISSPWIVDYTI